jgi:hypothetical protein
MSEDQAVGSRRARMTRPSPAARRAAANAVIPRMSVPVRANPETAGGRVICPPSTDGWVMTDPAMVLEVELAVMLVPSMTVVVVELGRVVAVVAVVVVGPT